MEVLLNKLFDKHSEGYGVYDRENLIKDICKELQNLQLQQTGVVRCFPKSKQSFYVLLNKDYLDFFQSKTDTHVFTAPLILDAMFFKNKILAEKHKEENNLKDFDVVNVCPNYFKNEKK